MNKHESINDEILKEIAASNMLILKQAVGGIIISFVVSFELWQVGL
jgi:hypothetical protein